MVIFQNLYRYMFVYIYIHIIYTYTSNKSHISLHGPGPGPGPGPWAAAGPGFLQPPRAQGLVQTRPHLRIYDSYCVYIYMDTCIHVCVL